MKKLSNLLDKDLKIVEKKKIIFLIPVIVVIIAAIMAVVYNFTADSPINLGMDFAGGYTINVTVSDSSQEDLEAHKESIHSIVENYADEDGNVYGVKVSQIQITGKEDNKSLLVKFKSLPDTNDDSMKIIVDGIVEKIKDEVQRARPDVEQNGSSVKCTYNIPVESYLDILEEKVSKLGGTNLKFDKNTSKKSITFTYSGNVDDIESALSISQFAEVYAPGKVGATVSQDLLYNAISAILIALVLMLVYIAIRFEFKSGVAAIVALVHDLIIMFSFMVIFHVEFNSTFIAALITILGYSINNSIILFDRVRSNLKLNANWERNSLANTSISQSFVRCLNTTITTIIMIASIAIVCAIASIANADLYQMVTFSLPIIVGLLSGFYSAMFVAPSVWASLGGTKTPKVKVTSSEAR